MTLRRFLAPLVAVTILCTTPNVNAGEDERFTIYDYFVLNRVTELALSSDGQMIVYVIESPSLGERNTTRSVFISATTPGAKALLTSELQEGRSFSWIPETHQLAYLLPVDGLAQVISTNIDTNRSVQHTDGDFPVIAFQFAPDGSSLAWLTQSSSSTTFSLYQRLFHADTGIIIDPDHTVVYQFVNPDWPNVNARTSNQLWLKRVTARNAEPLQVPVPGKTKTFYWSSDANKLSIAYSLNGTQHAHAHETYTSLGVYTASTATFRSICQARPPSKQERTVYYTGGEWIPGKNRILVHRIEEDHLGWEQKAEWSVIDTSKGAAPTPEEHWHRIDVYGGNAEPVFLPVDGDTVYSERTIRAVPSLYEMTPSGFKRARILESIEGAISSVRFAADFATAAFVNEDLDRPPEVYIWRDGHKVTQLTNLNRELNSKTLPRGREVVWQSKDGVPVHGWLFQPYDRNNKPWPLITFVHGGPTFAFTNEFAVYFSLWPYPFEAYAVSGIAVFIPNYRGTSTFGYEFENPSATNKEPVDDIISGIDYLIAEGVADPERLGISGRSHGAWLAPLVMTKENRFAAASFAEGTINKIINYNLAPGFLNREVHDWLHGASLYDDPAKYIELSPDMHFKGLDTAVLFEAGVQASAITMMGSVKAALYAGMPAEFVIYPKTGHGLRIPSLQRESAERNLDWFRFWLQDYEDPDGEKVEQYFRWRKMRLNSERRAGR